MNRITISPELLEKWPDMLLACMYCEVDIVSKDEGLWQEIDRLSHNLRETKKIEEISKTPAIAASRKGYKATGKDPARYRLSAEALMRRVVKGNDLYQINNVVDIVNLVSATSGFSIGGYDLNGIDGDIEFGIGKANEPYQAIGRGELNIEFLPLLRDQIGAFGSPTSDSVRTSVTDKTNRFLMIYFAFGAFQDLQEALYLGEDLLKKYANAHNFEKWIVE